MGGFAINPKINHLLYILFSTPSFVLDTDFFYYYCFFEKKRKKDNLWCRIHFADSPRKNSPFYWKLFFFNNCHLLIVRQDFCFLLIFIIWVSLFYFIIFYFTFFFSLSFSKYYIEIPFVGEFLFCLLFF